MSTVKIIHLYPKSMNLYGDHGNILTLKKRLKWRGIDAEIINHDIDDSTDFSQADIVVGGGGQDAQQDQIQADLLRHKSELASLAERNVPMLLVCGMYQLFGKSFITETDETIEGLDILPIDTKAGRTRLTGNIIIDSERFGYIVGYENHSGQTHLDDDSSPLGQVVLGAGNNADDGHEGIIYRNIIATYLHGPILPRNPQVADYLIAQALKNKGIKNQLEELPIDNLAYLAQKDALERKR